MTLITSSVLEAAGAPGVWTTDMIWTGHSTPDSSVAPESLTKDILVKLALVWSACERVVSWWLSHNIYWLTFLH